MKYASSIFLILLSWTAFSKAAFEVIPLGVKGGLDESNMSAYLLAPAGSQDYVCVDAGTIHAGIEKAISKKLFQGKDVQTVQKNHIKAYVISHAHLDHVAGLIINSTDDSPKHIYAMASTLNYLKTYYFNWKTWPNFGNEGEGFFLKTYTYRILPSRTESPIEGSKMLLTAFPLSHSNYMSSAFLFKSNEDYILYFGDTGADTLEKSTHLKEIWTHIAPLMKAKKLRAIFLETSYPDEQPDKSLFGHLNPRWLNKEMDVLAQLAGKEALKDFQVIVTHMKPSGQNEAKIKTQLIEQNRHGLKYIFPEQGVRYEF